jgi:hypothetical protein
MQQSPLEVDSRSASQDMPLELCNHKIRVNNSPKLDPSWAI